MRLINDTIFMILVVFFYFFFSFKITPQNWSRLSAFFWGLLKHHQSWKLPRHWFHILAPSLFSHPEKVCLHHSQAKNCLIAQKWNFRHFQRLSLHNKIFMRKPKTRNRVRPLFRAIDRCSFTLFWWYSYQQMDERANRIPKALIWFHPSFPFATFDFYLAQNSKKSKRISFTVIWPVVLFWAQCGQYKPFSGNGLWQFKQSLWLVQWLIFYGCSFWQLFIFYRS